MSIKTVQMFTILCDLCGRDACEGTDYAGYSDVSGVEETSMEGWITRALAPYEESPLHYCPNCCEVNDEDGDDDGVTIKAPIERAAT